jgi:TRAP-type C4-dicarboxylate transport system permease small subunit
MLGSAIAIDRNEHLRLTVFLGMIPELVRDFVNVLALLVVATMLLALIVPASQCVQEERYVTSAALNIPMSFRASAIIAGLALMSVIAVGHAIRVATPAHQMAGAVFEEFEGGRPAQGEICNRLGAGSSGPGWGNGKAAAVAFAREGARVALRRSRRDGRC